MTTEQHWVGEYLVPLNPCDSSGAIRRARQYPDPQSAWDAWDAWDDGIELLWNLRMCDEKDNSKLTLCACEIAERVLSIFEEKHPDDDRPRKAIEAARRYAENPSKENRDAAACAAAAAAFAAHAAERKAQADIVRKYFPTSPFCKSGK